MRAACLDKRGMESSKMGERVREGGQRGFHGDPVAVVVLLLRRRKRRVHEAGNEGARERGSEARRSFEVRGGNRDTSEEYNAKHLIRLHGAVRLGAPAVTRRRHPPGPQQPAALLVVVLVHADQQADALRAGCHPQGQSAAQVVGPEGLQVVQLGEVDVADDGSQVSGTKQRAGFAEQLKLTLQGLPLVRRDALAEGRIVLQVFGPDTQADF
ncbi:hypothetical protein EYF80_008139 [Liparis tanakae]|uniref:Uncharacterized protein n=1 Tax=Liparis tanakae TaxID=230148 RepID=A0A4Z2IWQ8_9TELE|nr:hypothetical protein EYF80_008139 [Liparis tanakae]